MCFPFFLHVNKDDELWHLTVVLFVTSVLSSGSGASPHPELPQGQMDSLLSIISSQRERFRSRNQELEVVSHRLSRTIRIPVSFSGGSNFSSVCFLCFFPAGESLHAADHAGPAE